MTPEAIDVLLALADDEICLGHWYATWIGLGPFLEEDLAFTSIGQDELGHARALYSLIAPEATPLELDALAYRRRPDEYRCAWLCEDPTPKWEHLFVRHLFYDEAETVRWSALVGSALPGLSDVAKRALAEESYHTRHARSLFVRLMSGGVEARERLVSAAEELLGLAAELFEPTAGEAAALAQGVLTSSSADQRAEWQRRVGALFGEAGRPLEFPDPASQPGGRRGVRSPEWANLHAEMTKVYALDPEAIW